MLRSIISGEADVLIFDETFYFLSTGTEQHYIDNIEHEPDKSFVIVNNSELKQKLLEKYPTIKLKEVETIEEGLSALSSKNIYNALTFDEYF